MKVMIVSRGYPSEEYPLNGNHEYDYARAMKRQGIDCFVVALDLRSIRRKRKFGYGKREVQGIETYTVDLPGGAISKKALGRLGCHGLKRIYKDILRDGNEPDIIHAHFTDPAYQAALFNEGLGLPLLITEHSSEIRKDDIQKDLYETADFCYRRADVLMTVSQALKDSIREKFSLDSIVEPPMVDLTPFYPGDHEEGRIRFVSCGNLKKVKRMDLLIRAFYMGDLASKGASLDIYGEGPERERLSYLIEKTRLKGLVVLHGNVDHESLARAYGGADCFCLASDVENFGKAYVEALASGLPLIGTKCGGPETIINEKNGLLVERDDCQALAEALNYMAKNYPSYDKMELREDAQDRFGEEGAVKRLLSYYEMAIEKRNRDGK